MPGKVPRGSFLKSNPTSGFSPLGRFILDKLDRGVLLLDKHGYVIDGNSLAQRALANGSGILLRNGRFALADPELDARFSQLVEGNGRSGSHRAIAARIRRAAGEPYRILISPVGPDESQREAAFVAVLYGPDRQRKISVEVLMEMYGLTRAQADVARKLYAGRSVESTAAELSLSLNTVRSHLKQIFSKCEVQSQAELLHALAVGPHSL